MGAVAILDNKIKIRHSICKDKYEFCYMVRMAEWSKAPLFRSQSTTVGVGSNPASD